jgi:hypothetical protein
MDSYAAKAFPDNYSKHVITILEAMSLTKLKKISLVGSAALRNQLYAGDFDAMEKVNIKSADDMVGRMRDSIKALRAIPECFVSDIKCGEVREWNAFKPTARVEDGKILDFNIKQSQSVIDRLRAENVISESEANESNYLLDKATTPIGFLTARKEIRFHILRWRPLDILSGVLHYRGQTIKLGDAIMSGGMIKTDVISNIVDRFTEFSMIYDVYVGKKRITAAPPNIINSLKEDVLYYNKSNPFKALKRYFALAKAMKSEGLAKLLVPILNSDLGRLYQIIGDLTTLETLLVHKLGSTAEIKAQIDEMKARMGNLYQLRDFLKKEHAIIGEIEAIMKSPVSAMRRKVTVLIDELKEIMDEGAVKILKEVEKKLDSVV